MALRLARAGDRATRQRCRRGDPPRRPRATAADAYRLLGAVALDLEHALGRTIDLVVLEPRTSPILVHHVLAEGRLVHDADPDRRIGFEWRAHVRYLDWKPTWEAASRVAAAELREWLEGRK